MRILLFTSISFLLLLSCSDKPAFQENNLNTEIKLIELSAQLDNLKMTQANFNAIGADSNRLDSLCKIEVHIEAQIDTISRSTGLTITQAELNCIKEFNLSIEKLNSQQRNFLLQLYGYKICGPGWIACGFTIDST